METLVFSSEVLSIYHYVLMHLFYELDPQRRDFSAKVYMNFFLKYKLYTVKCSDLKYIVRLILATAYIHVTTLPIKKQDFWSIPKGSLIPLPKQYPIPGAKGTTDLISITRLFLPIFVQFHINERKCTYIFVPTFFSFSIMFLGSHPWCFMYHLYTPFYGFIIFYYITMVCLSILLLIDIWLFLV